MVGETTERESNSSGGIIIESVEQDSDTRNDDSIPVIEPREIPLDTESVESRPRRKYTRRNASARSASAKPSKETQDGLTNILFSLHLMGAALMNTPELALTEDEAEKLGSAVAKVNAQYGGLIIDQKTEAWINLLFVVGSLYGPRFITVKNNSKNKKEKEKVVDISQGKVM